MTEQPPICLACGFALCRTSWSLFVDLRSLTCTYCGGVRQRQRDAEEASASRDLSDILSVVFWPLVALLVVAIAVCIAYPVHADEAAQERAQTARELRQDQIEQAAAASMAEGAAPRLECYQRRNQGRAALCITRAEWGRIHAGDRSALPEQRVGMRL